MSNSFSHGNHFEERLVQALLIDHLYAEQMLEVLDVNYFNLSHLQHITNTMIEYHKKYKSIPSVALLQEILKKDISNDSIKNNINVFFQTIKEQPLNGDASYIKDSGLEFCRKQKILLSLEKCLDLSEQKSFDSIVNEIQSAVSAGAEKDYGHIYEDGFEERMTEINRKPIETPWPPINKLIGGGISAGELGVILALTGVGKSHALVDLACAAAKAGKNVFYFTFELSEVKVGKRVDARISGIEYDNLLKHKDFVQSCVDKLPGRVRIKKYPNRKATVQTIRNYVNKMKLEDVEPDLIVIDYADIMKSSKHYENKRFQEEAVYEELRSLSDEINVPVWTASQTNRSGMDAEVLTLKHIAECFAKANISDLFITMNRKKTGENETLGNMFIAKSRLGTDGIKLNVIVNTALSKITCLEPQSAQEREVMLKYDLQLESDSSRIKKTIMEAKLKNENFSTQKQERGIHNEQPTI